MTASKVVDLTTAVERHVRSGDTLFLSGMQHGEPTGAVLEILRQGINGLTLIPQIPVVAELLLSEGRVRRLITAYTSALYARRGEIARRVSEDSSIELVEFSHGALHLALQAAQFGVPFLPTRALLGSDYLRVNPEFLSTVPDPFGGPPVAAVRALRPDVAILHVQEADRAGNAVKLGSLGMDVAGVHAAQHVIVTCERIVDDSKLKASPNLVTVPGFLVDAVVEVPMGSWPQHLYGEYGDDLRTWFGSLTPDAGYRSVVDELVVAPKSHEEFLAALTKRFGEAHMEELRAAALRPNAALNNRLEMR